MRLIKYNLFVVLLILAIAPQRVVALQVISPAEGESMFVNISQTELNLIQFPFGGIRAYTSSPKVDIKVQSHQVLVTMTDPQVSKPQEVFFSTPHGTYLLMLVPKGIPAETIVMKISKEKFEEAEEWEKESDYVTRLKELIKALYAGIPPSGYSMSAEKEDVSMWEGVEQTVTMTMVGAGLAGEVQDLTNHGALAVNIEESEFYKEGVLAVALSSHEINPGSKGQAFIVRRNSGSSR
jgi:conjugal transfer pilus assembly protein TraK